MLRFNVILYFMLLCGWSVVGALDQHVIDVEKLEQQWNEDDEDSWNWHEDTPEWREKIQKAPGAMGKANVRPNNMLFVTLNRKLDQEQAGELGAKWTALLETGGIEVTPYTPEDGMILLLEKPLRLTRSLEIKDYILQQPEVFKVRVNEDDFYPEDVGRIKSQIKSKDDKAAEKEREIIRQKQEQKEKEDKLKRKKMAAKAMERMKQKKEEQRKERNQHQN